MWVFHSQYGCDLIWSVVWHKDLAVTSFLVNQEHTATTDCTESRGEQTQFGLVLLLGLGPLLNWGTAFAGEIHSLSEAQSASRKNSMKWQRTAKHKNAQIPFQLVISFGVCNRFKVFQVVSSLFWTTKDLALRSRSKHCYGKTIVFIQGWTSRWFEKENVCISPTPFKISLVLWLNPNLFPTKTNFSFGWLNAD